MKYLILKGSPRKSGNTNMLAMVVEEEIERNGDEIVSFDLYDMNIAGCLACRECQKDWATPGCAVDDDMQKIFEAVSDADAIVVATPIHSWYCTAPVKAVLDRLVYGMNKYYGDEKGPSLWAGKHFCVIATCGYPVEKGADIFDEGMKRYCRHSRLVYDGMLKERHMGYDVPFMTRDKVENAKSFATELLQAVSR